MFSGSITKDDMLKSKVDLCDVCSLRVKVNSVLCVQLGKWNHKRCAGMKRVTPKFSRYLACIKCEGNIGEALEKEEKLCDEVETVRKLTYIGYRENAGGGREAAVTARTRCGWAKCRDCGNLLYGRFPLMMKGAVYKSCAWLAILYGIEAWCLKDSRMKML